MIEKKLPLAWLILAKKCFWHGVFKNNPPLVR
jgi:hypothetical protein